MTVRSALQRFDRKRVEEANKAGRKAQPPCPWRPTPIEVRIGGNCTKCGYPTRQHKEAQSNARRK